MPVDRFQHRLTLRWQLALFNTGLFMVLCLGLLTFINVLTVVTKPGRLTEISGIGFVLAAICGGIGAHILAGRALRPLRQVSAAAANISIETLNTRVAYQGAQDELKTL